MRPANSSCRESRSPFRKFRSASTCCSRACDRIGGPIVAPPEIFGDTLALVHDRRYIQFLSTLWERWSRIPDAAESPSANVFALGRANLPPAGYPDSVVGQCGYHLGDGSCPVTAMTWEAARASAATAAHGARLVLHGEKLAYALCRPPGHHAASDVAAGFCYFNNAALAAEILTRAGKRTRHPRHRRPSRQWHARRSSMTAPMC